MKDALTVNCRAGLRELNLHRRSYKHWTPRYLYDRLRLEIYERLHPDHPWLTKSANRILARRLQSHHLGLEFGSGRSTLWIARRVGHLTSVEHDPAWAKKVSEMLNSAGLTNVDYLLNEADCGDAGAAGSEYVRALDRFGPQSLDFVLVDGIYRADCALGATEKLRPGGLLIIDNVNWYLPCSSCAPNSRRADQGPVNEKWLEFESRVADWARDWTSSGVTDTAIFHKS